MASMATISTQWISKWFNHSKITSTISWTKKWWIKASRLVKTSIVTTTFNQRKIFMLMQNRIFKRETVVILCSQQKLINHNKQLHFLLVNLKNKSRQSIREKIWLSKITTSRSCKKKLNKRKKNSNNWTLKTTRLTLNESCSLKKKTMKKY